MKKLNEITFVDECHNDTCTEPTKRLVGHGSYGGKMARERITQGKSKHFNVYNCDKCKKECKERVL